jgi:hypothetical protein
VIVAVVVRPTVHWRIPSPIAFVCVKSALELKTLPQLFITFSTDKISPERFNYQGIEIHSIVTSHSSLNFLLKTC